MKKNFIILIAVFVFFGCDEYLDEVPDNRQTVTTLKDVSELLVSAYSEATYNFTDGLTDNNVAIPGNTQLDEWTENFQYKQVRASDQQDTPAYLWNNNYQAISHSNQALVALESIDDSDTAYKNALRGEALITRAYNHFLLANVFCLHYNEANKNTLGIPYITAPETSLDVDYERGTLEETYNLIEQDLLEGLPLISNEYYVGTGKYHFNINASLAFASRFYLYKGEYQKCIDFSDELLGTGVIGTTYVRDMDDVFTGNSSAQIANRFIDVTLPSNLLVVRKLGVAVTRYNRGYQPDVNVFGEIYGANVQGESATSDFRNLRYGFGSGASAPPKYTELFEFTTATTGFGYFIMPELRSEEVIINRMEAYIRLSRLEDALNDYNVFATLRFAGGGQLVLSDITTYFGGTDQEAMLDFVVSERRKEFLREGLRWYDIKRFDLEVEHIDVLGEQFNLTAQDLKKAVQIPLNASSNGIEENPR